MSCCFLRFQGDKAEKEREIEALIAKRNSEATASPNCFSSFGGSLFVAQRIFDSGVAVDVFYVIAPNPAPFSKAEKIADAEAQTEAIEREMEASAAQIPDLEAQLAAKKKEVGRSVPQFVPS